MLWLGSCGYSAYARHLPVSSGSSRAQFTSPWRGLLAPGTAAQCRFSSLSPACTAGSCLWFERKHPSHSCESMGTSQWFGLDTSSLSGGSTLGGVGHMSQDAWKGEKDKSLASLRLLIPNILRLGYYQVVCEVNLGDHRRINRLEEILYAHLCFNP